MYRNEQQFCEWVSTVESQNRGLSIFQSFLQRVEEKTRENVRKELEEREKRIQLNELNRAAAASSEEREMNMTTNDAIAGHLAAAEDEATARREAAARNEMKTELETVAKGNTKAEREAAVKDEAAAMQEAAARQAAVSLELVRHLWHPGIVSRILFSLGFFFFV